MVHLTLTAAEKAAMTNPDGTLDESKRPWGLIGWGELTEKTP